MSTLCTDERKTNNLLMVKRYYKQSSFTCPRKSQERSEKSILPPCPVFFPANLDLFDKIIYNSKVQFHMRV